jgi:tight adherence protein B
MRMIYVTVLITFFFLWTLIITVFLKLLHKDKPMDKLRYFDDEYVLREKYESHKKSKISPLKVISNLIPHSSLSKKQTLRVESELLKADIQVTAEEFLVAKILSSSAFAFLAFSVFKKGSISLAIFILVWHIPKLILERRKKQRIRLFDMQLSEGITIISNSLKSGYSFLQAVAVVALGRPGRFQKRWGATRTRDLLLRRPEPSVGQR